MMQCEGWRRKGGAFTMGPPEWSRCENDAIVMLTVTQESTQKMPACDACWREAIERGIKIELVHPLDESVTDCDNCELKGGCIEQPKTPGCRMYKKEHAEIEEQSCIT